MFSFHNGQRSTIQDANEEEMNFRRFLVSFRWSLVLFGGRRRTRSVHSSTVACVTGKSRCVLPPLTQPVASRRLLLSTSFFVSSFLSKNIFHFASRPRNNRVRLVWKYVLHIIYCDYISSEKDPSQCPRNLPQTLRSSRQRSENEPPNN